MLLGIRETFQCVRKTEVVIESTRIFLKFTDTGDDAPCECSQKIHIETMLPSEIISKPKAVLRHSWALSIKLPRLTSASVGSYEPISVEKTIVHFPP
jgi:hypothetical protein